MTTLNEQPDSSAQAQPASLSLQTDQAKATVEEIKADNAALKEADRAAEAQAEVVVEQAQQLAEVVGEVLEDLKEMKSRVQPG
jgi:gas vesicle protein